MTRIIKILAVLVLVGLVAYATWVGYGVRKTRLAAEDGNLNAVMEMRQKMLSSGELQVRTLDDGDAITIYSTDFEMLGNEVEIQSDSGYSITSPPLPTGGRNGRQPAWYVTMNRD